MSFTCAYDEAGLTLTLAPERSGLFGRLLARRAPRHLEDLVREERAVALALADLEATVEEDGDRDALRIDTDTLHLSHRLAARIDAATAAIIGLPPLADLVLRTDVEGSPGALDFRLRYQWLRDGQRQMPRRTGAIIETAEGPRRLPLWLMQAIEIADGFTPGRDEAEHWEALARFRRALDPVAAADPRAASRVGMTDFLKGLEVRLADCFAITPKGPDGALDFDPVPFSGQNLARSTQHGGSPDEAQGELDAQALAGFQRRLRQKGALPAYKVGQSSFLVIDRSAAPVLELMSRMQKAEPKLRDAFVRNPRPLIAEVIEERLRATGKLDNLSPAGEEEAIDATAGPLFVETREYSDRVTGVVRYEKRGMPPVEGGGTTWLPEVFSPGIAEKVKQMDDDALAALQAQIEKAIAQGEDSIGIGGVTVTANAETLTALRNEREARERSTSADGEVITEPAPDSDDDDAEVTVRGPLIIETLDNFDELQWRPQRGKRLARIDTSPPDGIRTPLKAHQLESLGWQIAAWQAGLPGVLNADEQGLGKTLQTIAFLRWLKKHTAQDGAEHRGPVLVVAPTSLLENWEAEVARHLDDRGLGHLIRLYGSGLGGFKAYGTTGIDTHTGEDKLDFSAIHEAITENRAHRFWILTTYTTLTNYQHSLGRIPFSALVFDEIQAIKNPASLRAMAARAMNADFCIGLTGTPIENSAIDLWAIMDQLCPGALGSLKDFRARFETVEPERMEELYARVFKPQSSLPALALRRLKEQVARDLPPKERRLYPKAMPPVQAGVYETARDKLRDGGKGAALKMLHHIRSVSVHPSIDEHIPDKDFVISSARLDATFGILHQIKARQERALVFIEHRKMQHRFLALAKAELGLERIDLINGDTPIQMRQEIVDRFQRHLLEDGGFDILVLGPRAAGTGLTLTAANHVIHLSRWWNPAVEEQCNDRVHRIGQTRPVNVHVPMAVHPSYQHESFDCLLHSLTTRKRRLATSTLWPLGDTGQDVRVLRTALADAAGTQTNDDPVSAAMQQLFARDGLDLPPPRPDGSIPIT